MDNSNKPIFAVDSVAILEDSLTQEELAKFGFTVEAISMPVQPPEEERGVQNTYCIFNKNISLVDHSLFKCCQS